MNFFKRNIEYNNLAKAFNGYYQRIQQLNEKAAYQDIGTELIDVAFLVRVEIIDRMDIINYKMSTRIVVPMMPGNKKTLEYAYLQTVGKLVTLAESQGLKQKVEEILEKGDLFYEIERTLPIDVKKMLNL